MKIEICLVLMALIIILSGCARQETEPAAKIFEECPNYLSISEAKEIMGNATETKFAAQKDNEVYCSFLNGNKLLNVTILSYNQSSDISAPIDFLDEGTNQFIKEGFKQPKDIGHMAFAGFKDGKFLIMFTPSIFSLPKDTYLVTIESTDNDSAFKTARLLEDKLGVFKSIREQNNLSSCHKLPNPGYPYVGEERYRLMCYKSHFSEISGIDFCKTVESAQFCYYALSALFADPVGCELFEDYKRDDCYEFAFRNVFDADFKEFCSKTLKEEKEPCDEGGLYANNSAECITKKDECFYQATLSMHNGIYCDYIEDNNFRAWCQGAYTMRDKPFSHDQYIKEIIQELT